MGVVFQRLVLLSVGRLPDNMINAIVWKRNEGAPNLSDEQGRNLFQVRWRTAPTLQSGLICDCFRWLELFESLLQFLFPSN